MDNHLSARELAEQAIARAQSAPIVGKDDLVIWGGAFPAERLSAFFAAWGHQLDRMEWRMFEHVNTFQVFKASLNHALPSADLLERARIFGAPGDLDLRRDGERFRWRFIGDAKQTLPPLAGDFAPQEFWANQSASLPEFREIETRYYQWHRDERRVDSRWLDTAGLKAEGVYLIQKQYLRDGRVEFVRFVKFEGEV